jgi:hypothetical protein
MLLNSKDPKGKIKEKNSKDCFLVLGLVDKIIYLIYESHLTFNKDRKIEDSIEKQSKELLCQIHMG